MLLVGLVKYFSILHELSPILYGAYSFMRLLFFFLSIRTEDT